MMATIDRRFFLKASGATFLPMISPFSTHFKLPTAKPEMGEKKIVKFHGDGEVLEPLAYLKKLEEIHEIFPIERDKYGLGGVVEAIEAKFAELTGKEKAIYVPSGTMANQLAIALFI